MRARAQVSKIEAGCMALEQAAIGMPGDPVPGDLQGTHTCLAQQETCVLGRTLATLGQAGIGMPGTGRPAGCLAQPDSVLCCQVWSEWALACRTTLSPGSLRCTVGFHQVWPALGRPLRQQARAEASAQQAVLKCRHMHHALAIASRCDVQRARACAAGLLQPCLAHLPPPPEPLHAQPQTVAQAVSACLHARMALLRSLQRHAPDTPQVTLRGAAVAV